MESLDCERHILTGVWRASAGCLTSACVCLLLLLLLFFTSFRLAYFFCRHARVQILFKMWDPSYWIHGKGESEHCKSLLKSLILCHWGATLMSALWTCTIPTYLSWGSTNSQLNMFPEVWAAPNPSPLCSPNPVRLCAPQNTAGNGPARHLPWDTLSTSILYTLSVREAAVGKVLCCWGTKWIAPVLLTHPLYIKPVKARLRAAGKV